MNVNNYVKLTNVDEWADWNIRKFLQIKNLKTNIELQLGGDSY